MSHTTNSQFASKESKLIRSHNRKYQYRINNAPLKIKGLDSSGNQTATKKYAVL